MAERKPDWIECRGGREARKWGDMMDRTFQKLDFKGRREDR